MNYTKFHAQSKLYRPPVHPPRLAAEGYRSQADAVAAVKAEERRARERKTREILQRLASLVGENPEDLTEAIAQVALAVWEEVRE